MLNTKKIIILLCSSVTLYYALISPTILPRVTVCPLDAFWITVFVVGSSLIVRYLSMLEARALENKILVQHTLMHTIINNNTSLVMYLKKIDGTILLSNNKHAELVGFKPEEIVGLCAKDLYQDPEFYEEEDRQIIETKQPLKIERFLKTYNDEGHWYRITKTPVLNQYNEVMNIVVILENIDAEKELEERKNTFIATMTHDLKTPTLAQINAVNLLLKGYFGKMSDAQQEILNQIKDSCNYMSNLIFTILDTYVLDNGSIKIKLDKFNIEELLDEVVSQISNLLIDKKQTVKIHSSVSLNEIVADKLQIKRVILNLLSNANTYGFPDSNIDIYIGESKKPGFIFLDVVNKSHYLSDDSLVDVFDKFKQAKNAKFRKTGTGLGLYISKQIIDAHGGEIHASSNKENETSTFGFSIPVNCTRESELVINNN